MNKKPGSLLLTFALLLTLLPSVALPATAAGYTWPVPGHTHLSQKYHSGHQAIDISDGSIRGATIVAAIGGKVTVKHTCPDQHYGSMGDCNGFGNGLVIAGDDGRYYSYGHMLHGSIPSNVYKGAYVSTGQTIGQVGTTGNSSGPHLHFSVANNSRYWENCIDPMPLFQGNSQPSASVTFAFPTNPGYASKYWVGEKNAVLVSQVSGTLSSVTQVGIRLYDASGKQVASKSETPIAAFNNASTSYMWYDINAELGYALTPGTKYQYKFYAISGGKTYTSDTYTFTTTGTAPQTPEVKPVTTTFSDVKPTDYFSESVAWAVTHHITTGTGNGKFSPNQTCTRAQIITFLWRSIGEPTPSSNVQGFTDVPTDVYYYNATRWARAMGMADGSYFYPDSDCTRAMAVKFMYQFAGSPSMRAPTQFTDVPSNAHYASAVQWALDKGVTKGTSATTFSPNQTCTRGQIVTFLFRSP